MTEKKEEVRKIAVVSELPKQSVKVVETEDGKKYDLVTQDEALTEILETTRELKKNMLG